MRPFIAAALSAAAFVLPAALQAQYKVVGQAGEMTLTTEDLGLFERETFSP